MPDYQGVFLRGYGKADSLGRSGNLGVEIEDNFSSGDIGEVQGDATRNEKFFSYNHFGPSSDYWSFHGGISMIGNGNWEWNQRDSGDGSWYSMNAVGVNYDYGEKEWHIPLEGPVVKDVQCSGGGGGDGEDGDGGGSSVSCDVTYAEEAIDKVALYSNNYQNGWWFPTEKEFRPVNVAVKFMIKAK